MAATASTSCDCGARIIGLDRIYHVGALLSGQRGPGLVNNHDMNAVMHAAGTSNIQFFDWFYERAHPIAERGFLWDQKNDAKRNMLSMVNQKAFVFHPERCSDG